MRLFNYFILIIMMIFFFTALNVIEIFKELEMTGKTEHFDIYTGEDDPIYLPDLTGSLEENYTRIVSSLGMEGELPRISVRIYPTIEEFHKAVNMVGSPNWALGTISGTDEFSMASPLSPDLPVSYEDMTLKLPIHEFTHVVVYNIVDPQLIPYWLWEGISLYMAGQRADLSRLSNVQEGIFPEFDELGSMQNSFQYGYSLVEFIVETKGVQTLKDLLINKGNIEKTYDISIAKFYRDWQTFVAERYPGN